MEALILAVSLLCGVDNLQTNEVEYENCILYYVNCTIEGAGTWSEKKLLECKNEYPKR